MPYKDFQNCTRYFINMKNTIKNQFIVIETCYEEQGKVIEMYVSRIMKIFKISLEYVLIN